VGIKPDLSDENHKIDLRDLSGCGIDRFEIQIDRFEIQIDRFEIQIDRSVRDRALPNERTGTGRSKYAARFLFVLHNAQDRLSRSIWSYTERSIYIDRSFRIDQLVSIDRSI